jgi:hypothetical protein
VLLFEFLHCKVSELVKCHGVVVVSAVVGVDVSLVG